MNMYPFDLTFNKILLNTIEMCILEQISLESIEILLLACKFLNN